MDETFLEFLIVVLGFVIRLGIPIGLTALLAWFLRRLDARWQAEAAALQTAQSRPRGATMAAMPCWRVRGCSPDQRKACPAYAHPFTPCWEVFRVNGHLRDSCPDCVVYKQAMAPVGVSAMA